MAVSRYEEVMSLLRLVGDPKDRGDLLDELETLVDPKPEKPAKVVEAAVVKPKAKKKAK